MSTSKTAKATGQQEPQAEAPAYVLPYTLAAVAVADLSAHPRNVRQVIEFEPGFLDSLTEDGVLLPLLATQDLDTPEALRVIDGHRRLAGAIEVGLTTVPVLIARDVEAGRQFLAMLQTSIYKQNLTAIEEAAALFSANEEGLSWAKLTKTAGRKRVEAAKKYAKVNSKTRATVAATDYTGSLEELAGLGEFADDEEATARLVTAIKNGGFRHQIERERRMQQSRNESAKERDALIKAGVRIISEPTKKAAHVYNLRTPDGQSIGEEAHKACPGHVAYYRSIYSRAEILCEDFRAHGHVDGWARPARMGPQTEAQDRAERRNIRAGNQAQDAAEVVRREWLTEHLSGKLADKQIEALARFAAEAYLTSPTPIAGGMSVAPARLKNLAGMLNISLPNLSGMEERDQIKEINKALAQAAASVPAKRLPVLQFAAVAEAYENEFKRDTWRTDADHRHDWNEARRHHARVRLRFLASQGYTLSDIEQTIVDGTDYHGLTDAADAAALAELFEFYKEEERKLAEEKEKRAAKEAAAKAAREAKAAEQGSAQDDDEDDKDQFEA